MGLKVLLEMSEYLLRTLESFSTFLINVSVGKGCFVSWKANKKFSLVIIINIHCNIILDVFSICCRNLKNFLLKLDPAVTD